MMVFGLPLAFTKDIFILFLVTILLSSLLSLLVGGAADFFFGETISSFIGDFGEYDVIITLNEDPEGRGEKELLKVVEERFPNGRLQAGIPLASQENYFLSLAKEDKNREVFMNMSSYFSDLPGYAGTSLITEPRLSLRGVPTPVRSFLEKVLSQVEGVSFAYPISTGIDLILTSTREAQEISQRVEEILKEYQILEVTLPVEEGGLGDLHRDALMVYLQEEYGLSVQNISSRNEEDPLILALFELRRFLEYLGDHGGNFEEALKEAQGLLPHLEGLFTQGHYLLDEAFLGLKDYEKLLEEGRRLEELLYRGERVFSSLAGEEANLYIDHLLSLIEPFLHQVQDFQEDIQALDFVRRELYRSRDTLLLLEGILERGKEVSHERNQRLSPLLLEVKEYRQDVEGQVETLLSSINQKNPLLPLLSSIQESLISLQSLLSSGKEALGGEIFSELNQGLLGLLHFMEAEGEDLPVYLEEIRFYLSNLEDVEWLEMLKGLEVFGEGLSSFNGQETSLLINLLDQFLLGQVLPSPEGIYLLLPSSFSLDEEKEELSQVLGVSGVSFSSRNLGLIQPNLHVEVLRVIEQARLIIISIMAILFTLLSLLLDQSLILSAIRERALWQGSRLFFLWDKSYGFISGGILLLGIIQVSGGEIPYLGPIHFFLLGGVMGILMASLAGKINPLDREEMMAGLSMGFTYTDLLRDIIIPVSRPGLLYLLNKPRMVFP